MDCGETQMESHLTLIEIQMGKYKSNSNTNTYQVYKKAASLGFKLRNQFMPLLFCLVFIQIAHFPYSV